MKHRKSLIAAMMLCALSLSAVAASSALAAPELTAVKCVEKGTGLGNYSSECPTPEKVGGGFETEALAPGVVTEVEGQATTSAHKTGTTASPVVTFKGTAAGIAIQVTCGKAALTGKVQNVAGPPMKAKGTEGIVTYTECHAAKQSDLTAICTVKGKTPVGAVGEIKTNKLVSENTGTEHNVLIKPETGTTFTEFEVIAGAAPCFTAANIIVGVTGEVTAVANTETHAHITLTPTTNGTKFKANGATATYESTQQSWMKGKPAELVGAQTFG